MTTTTSRVVLAKLFRDLKPGDATWTADAVEWIGEALDFIGYGVTLIIKSAVLPVVAHRVTLPTDFGEIVGVDIDGQRLTPNLDTRSFDPTRLTQSYYLAGGGTKAIFCGLETGELTLTYYAFPIDEKGYPLIPDTVYYRQALWWYILRQMMLSGYAHPLFSWSDCDAQWKHYCAAARNDVNMPSVEQTEQAYRKWVRLLPDTNRWMNYFSSDDFVSVDSANVFTGGVTTRNRLNEQINATMGNTRIIHTITWAATTDRSLIIAQTLGYNAAEMPSVFLGVFQDTGTLTNSFYFSVDGGVTAQTLPTTQSRLYVNPSILGTPVPAGEELTITILV